MGFNFAVDEIPLRNVTTDVGNQETSCGYPLPIPQKIKVKNKRKYSKSKSLTVLSSTATQITSALTF